MEITASNIYWITRLDALEGLFILFASVGILVSAISALLSIIEKGDEGDDEIQSIARRVLKFSVPALIVSLLGIAFVPNTEEAAAMWVVPKVTNGESLPTVGTNFFHPIDINLNLNNLKVGH